MRRRFDDIESELRKIECFDDFTLYSADMCQQAADEIRRLHDALLACKVARHALADLNGEVSREVWERLYPVTRQLDEVLGQCLHLSPRDGERFAATLESDVEPNEALKRAADRYKGESPAGEMEQQHD